MSNKKKRVENKILRVNINKKTNGHSDVKLIDQDKHLKRGRGRKCPVLVFRDVLFPFRTLRIDPDARERERVVCVGVRNISIPNLNLLRLIKIEGKGRVLRQWQDIRGQYDRQLVVRLQLRHRNVELWVKRKRFVNLSKRFQFAADWWQQKRPLRCYLRVPPKKPSLVPFRPGSTRWSRLDQSSMGYSGNRFEWWMFISLESKQFKLSSKCWNQLDLFISRGILFRPYNFP